MIWITVIEMNKNYSQATDTKWQFNDICLWFDSILISIWLNFDTLDIHEVYSTVFLKKKISK